MFWALGTPYKTRHVPTLVDRIRNARHQPTGKSPRCYQTSHGLQILVEDGSAHASFFAVVEVANELCQDMCVLTPCRTQPCDLVKLLCASSSFDLACQNTAFDFQRVMEESRQSQAHLTFRGVENDVSASKIIYSWIRTRRRFDMCASIPDCRTNP